MKSVPIIFLIFMFIILTIPAYAADTKKITSVNIQRIYKAKEGEINPDHPAEAGGHLAPDPAAV